MSFHPAAKKGGGLGTLIDVSRSDSFLATAAAVLIVACASAAGAAVSPAATPLPTLSGSPAWGGFERMWADVAAYTATVTVFEQKGTQVQTLVFDYAFRKPSSVTVRIVRGPNTGATLAWNGGDTVLARRGGGFLAIFKKTYSLHDPTVTTIRGSSIDELSFAAMISHAQDTPGAVFEISGEAIDGVPVEAVTILPSSAEADAGLTREVVDISPATNVPLRVLGYDGAGLVRQVDFSAVKLER